MGLYPEYASFQLGHGGNGERCCGIFRSDGSGHSANAKLVLVLIGGDCFLISLRGYFDAR